MLKLVWKENLQLVVKKDHYSIIMFVLSISMYLEFNEGVNEHLNNNAVIITNQVCGHIKLKDCKLHLIFLAWSIFILNRMMEILIRQQGKNQRCLDSTCYFVGSLCCNQFGKRGWMGRRYRFEGENCLGTRAESCRVTRTAWGIWTGGWDYQTRRQQGFSVDYWMYIPVIVQGS